MRADVERWSQRHLEEAQATGRPLLLVVSGTSGLDRWILRRAVRRWTGEVAILGLARSRGEAEREAARRLASFRAAPVVLPTLVVWSRAARRPPRGLGAWLFGSPDHPTRLRRLIDAVAHGRRVFIQIGPAIAERSEAVDGSVRLQVASWRRALRDERRVVVGPPLPRAEPFFRAIESHPLSQAEVSRIAAETGNKTPAVFRRFRRELRITAARYQHEAVVLLYWLLRVLWTRIYRGVEVREEDIERIRQAIRDGSAVLVPSHRSHLDYLLLSWLLYVHRVVVPHIVAGRNMDLPVAGQLLRGAGAFFIKRSFRDDPVHAVVFERYLREMVRRGFLLEYFIEGGRSRTGRMLPPRLGVLARLVEAAAQRRPYQEVTLLPLAISFEKVAETRSYVRELRGIPKERESWWALLRATRRILGENHGRVVLRVGEPLLLGRRLVQMGWEDGTEEHRRDEVARLGRELVDRIGRAQVVMGVHVAALTAQSAPPGADHDSAFDRGRFGRWIAALRAVGAALDAELDDPGAMEAAREVVRRRGLLGAERRAELELLANHALHGLASAGLLAWSIEAEESLPTAPPPLYGVLTRLLGEELIGVSLEPDDPKAWQEARRIAVAFGIGDPVGSARCDEIREAFRPVIEAVWLVLEHGSAVVAELPGSKKRWQVGRLRELGEDELERGRIRRPEALFSSALGHALTAFCNDSLGHDETEGVASQLSARLATATP